MRAGWGGGRWVGAWLVLAVAGCQTASDARAPAAPPTLERLNAVLWLQTSAEYRASTLQAYGAATAALDRALADPTWTAALEQTGDYGELPPAIILDMDEAIIRSDRYQAGLVEAGKAFDLEDWNAWIRTETSQAVAGALEYVAYARRRGVRVFYVTNRTAAVERASLETLRKLGFPVEGGLEDLLTQDERPDWGGDKSSRRAFLCRSHRILQIVGDNLNDFISGAHTRPRQRVALAERYADWWGTRWIVTPNPAYGGWEGALYDFRYDTPRDEIQRRKREQLDPWP